MSEMGAIIPADTKKPFDIRKVPMRLLLGCALPLSMYARVVIDSVSALCSAQSTVALLTQRSFLMASFHFVQIIARIGDGSKFHEFKQLYAPTIVTGFTQIYGMQVGIVANNGILYSESALKVSLAVMHEMLL